MARELQMLDSRGGGMGGGPGAMAGGGAPAPTGAPTGFESSGGGMPPMDNSPTLTDDTDFEDDIPF